ncbi:ankyrin repeat domain-containing protein [Endozoicomonas sp. 8E]|uniref:ankyrin repeat domain-containing protein n=1 Tax=Endozoicomonas sp. 8E TaxID=3035692 RepID=UPI0029394956|nr:ankyrin repeat domain-containing protein [Endozoicomonas sp. 8E]WOG28632.1 ankyrin repeat domain-containing protein [Endozoicomonas sp. 8E]
MFYLWVALLTTLCPSIVKADQCPICLADFHGRSEAPVVVTTQCCGQRFDLDCISRCFADQPMSSRRCAMCRQDPMPVVNQNTSESHPNTFFPDRTFYLACVNGDLDQVERSLAEGVNVNAVMKKDTPLMLASNEGDEVIVDRLIKAGADVNTARTEDGATPLFIAVSRGYFKCVELLIKDEADLNTRFRDGNTLLLIAASRGSSGSVELLIKNGADLNAALPDGTTPLFLAVQENNSSCAKLLINAGADINAARTSDGATPLSIAIEMNNIDCALALIKAKTPKRTNEGYCIIL